VYQCVRLAIVNYTGVGSPPKSMHTVIDLQRRCARSILGVCRKEALSFNDRTFLLIRGGPVCLMFFLGCVREVTLQANILILFVIFEYPVFVLLDEVGK